jgi:hypothetical protein
VLDVGSKFVNHHLLDTERDNLWAAAVQAYNAGERWHLTVDEEAAINVGNKRYEIADDWTPIVEQYCSTRNAVAAVDILTQALGFQEKEISRRESMRITNVLTTLGWRKLGQRRDLIDGRYRRASYWVRGQIIEAMDEGKLSPDAELSDIKEINIDQMREAECLYLPDYTSNTDHGGIDTPNANDSNGYSEVSIPAIPFEEKNKKEETDSKPEDKPEPKIDPWRRGRINQINIYKEMLGWSDTDLRGLAIKLFKKSSFNDLTNPEIAELDDYIYRKLPNE